MSSYELVQNFHATSIPFVGDLESSLTQGRQAIKIYGVVPATCCTGEESFIINLQETPYAGEEMHYPIAIHLDFRVGVNAIIRNTFMPDWGHEERSTCPVRPGIPFIIELRFAKDAYQLFVDDRYICEYKHRLPVESIRYLLIDKDVELTKVERVYCDAVVVPCNCSSSNDNSVDVSFPTKFY